uniref:Gustatory receptor n=1 Tax=Anopheles dirus TaxID=7168 RepID=A0A182NBX1_9DIPT
MELHQSYLSNMRKLGVTLVRYDSVRGAFANLAWNQFAAQCICSCFCISYTVLRLTRDYNSLLRDENMLNQVINIITTVSFCIVWFVVPVQVYRKRRQMTSALNGLLQNDADLRRATANRQVCDGVPYQRAKAFGRIIQLDGVMCFLLLSVGYIVGYTSLEGTTPRLFLTIGVYLYEDLCLSLLFGFLGTLFLLCAAQLSCAARLLETVEDRASLFEQRVACFCATYDRVCMIVTPALYDYCGPIITTFCPMIIVQVSLRLFLLEEIFDIDKKWTDWFLIEMDILEWLWLCFDCKKLFIVLYVSDILQQQVSYGGMLLLCLVVYEHLAIHNSINSVDVAVEETALCTRHFDDYRLQNTRAAKQIQKFLLKNLHQKKKFSACGFFDIDNTVIYMVFSSIVTYLVILIQFKQLETDLTQSEGVFNVTSNLTTPGPS